MAFCLDDRDQIEPTDGYHCYQELQKILLLSLQRPVTNLPAGKRQLSEVLFTRPFKNNEHLADISN